MGWQATWSIGNSTQRRGGAETQSHPPADVTHTKTPRHKGFVTELEGLRLEWPAE